jgi:DNA-binding Lrp family transcriptional regulator
MLPDDRRLLERLQQGFPLVKRPFLVIAEQLGCTEESCLQATQRLIDEGTLRYIKPIINARELGYHSVLVGVKVASTHIEQVAQAVSRRGEVTHNYQRQGPVNLWFTFTAVSPEITAGFLDEVRNMAGVDEVLELPAVKTYKIGLQLEV